VALREDEPLELHAAIAHVSAPTNPTTFNARKLVLTDETLPLRTTRETLGTPTLPGAALDSDVAHGAPIKTLYSGLW
jgi:hypothetical protein